MPEKMPPIEKVYEAYSAIADERIIMHDTYALVKSSDGKKTYEVDWKDNVYSSSDNATYWQGYPGYPVLAVLMLQGKLPYHKENAEKMKNVPWKKWNDQYKRDYAAAAEHVFQELEEKGISTQNIRTDAEAAMQALSGLDLTVRRGRLKHSE